MILIYFKQSKIKVIWQIIATGTLFVHKLR